MLESTSGQPRETPRNIFEPAFNLSCVADLYEHYQKWCQKQSLRPSTCKDFMRVAKEEIETGFGMNPRHDLVGDNGKARRGWSGLALVLERAAGENSQNQSALSE